MADIHITITTTAGGHAAQLQQGANTLRDVYANFKSLSVQAQHMVGGTAQAPTYGTFEARFGIPAGKGATVYAALNAAVAVLENDANIKGIREQLG